MCTPQRYEAERCHDHAVTDVPRPQFEHFDERTAEGIRGATFASTDIMGFLGVRHVDVGPGVIRAEMDARADLMNPAGNRHGGVIAALCDHMLGIVCYPVIPRGAWAATTEFKLNYLAPVTGGRLLATSQILSLTKSTAVVRIEVVNENGDDRRLVCTAQGTCLIKQPRS
jgi:uncharacterized protein (TIGR00369 family)